MHARADSGGAVLHLALIGFGVGHEFRQRIGRKILARDQDPRRIREQRDVLEIGDGIVERLLVERLIDGKNGAARKQHGVTVGRRLRDASWRRSSLPRLRRFRSRPAGPGFRSDAPRGSVRWCRRGRRRRKAPPWSRPASANPSAFAEPMDASKSATGAATMVLTKSSSRGLWTLERLLTDVDCPSPIGLAQAASHSRRCGLFRARPCGLA